MSILSSSSRWKLAHPEQNKEITARWRIENRDYIRAYYIKKNGQSRFTVISHYSNGLMQCACCGENMYEFLTIDHMNNDGYLDRKKYGSSAGTGLYRRLIKNNFPSGYQVLCWNCNAGRAKQKDRICPHKKVIA